MPNVTISLSENLIHESKRLAKDTGRTFSGLVKIGLEKQLKINDDSNDGKDNE